MTVELQRIVVGPLETNCWIVHPTGEPQALIVDPGDEPEHILAAVADLEVVAIVLTHQHFDHVLGLPELADSLGVPVLSHPAEAPVWPHELRTLTEQGHFDAGTATEELLAADPKALLPKRALWTGETRPVEDGQQLEVGSLTATILHTPGHTPGGISVALPGHVLTGDTLFPGGPGLTGWPLSDFPTIMRSVEGLLTLPPQTAVHPGHGPDTTVGIERPSIEEWRRRGW